MARYDTRRLLLPRKVQLGRGSVTWSPDKQGLDLPRASLISKNGQLHYRPGCVGVRRNRCTESLARGVDEALLHYSNHLKSWASPSIIKGLQQTEEESQRALSRHWILIVQEYSKCELTVETDKMMAIAGIFERHKLISNRPNDIYVAGTWASSLIHDLLWVACFDESHAQRSVRSSTYRAPSFSWVSLDGPINWNSEGDSVEDPFSLYASITECKSELEHEQDVLGPVKGGFIRVQGIVQQLLLYIDKPRSTYEKLFHMLNLIGLHTEIMLHDNSDRKEMASQGLHWHDASLEGLASIVYGWIYLMPVKKKSVGLDRAEICEGLLVKRTSTRNGQYRRVGPLSALRDSLNIMHTIKALKGTLPEESYIERNIVDADMVTYTIEIV